MPIDGGDGGVVSILFNRQSGANQFAEPGAKALAELRISLAMRARSLVAVHKKRSRDEIGPRGWRVDIVDLHAVGAEARDRIVDRALHRRIAWHAQAGGAMRHDIARRSERARPQPFHLSSRRG